MYAPTNDFKSPKLVLTDFISWQLLLATDYTILQVNFTSPNQALLCPASSANLQLYIHQRIIKPQPGINSSKARAGLEVIQTQYITTQLHTNLLAPRTKHSSLSIYTFGTNCVLRIRGSELDQKLVIYQILPDSLSLTCRTICSQSFRCQEKPCGIAYSSVQFNASCNA